MANPASFWLFPFFSNTNLQKNHLGSSRIWTRIVRVEGVHSYHLTTATALLPLCFWFNFELLYLEYCLVVRSMTTRKQEFVFLAWTGSCKNSFPATSYGCWSCVTANNVTWVMPRLQNNAPIEGFSLQYLVKEYSV